MKAHILVERELLHLLVAAHVVLAPVHVHVAKAVKWDVLGDGHAQRQQLIQGL